MIPEARLTPCSDVHLCSCFAPVIQILIGPISCCCQQLGLSENIQETTAVLPGFLQIFTNFEILILSILLILLTPNSFHQGLDWGVLSLAGEEVSCFLVIETWPNIHCLTAHGGGCEERRHWSLWSGRNLVTDPWSDCNWPPDSSVFQMIPAFMPPKINAGGISGKRSHSYGKSLFS